MWLSISITYRDQQVLVLNCHNEPLAKPFNEGKRMSVTELLKLYEIAKTSVSEGKSCEEIEMAYVAAYEAIDEVEGLGAFQEQTDISSNDLLDSLQNGWLKQDQGLWKMNIYLLLNKIVKGQNDEL